MQSKEELKEKGKGVFESKAWKDRKAKIADRVKKHEEKAHKMAKERKKRKKLNYELGKSASTNPF